MKIEPLSEDHLASLNPGIRHTVKTLRGWNFDTRDSGDGSTHQHECDLPSPYVHISVPRSSMLHGELIRLMTLLKERAGIEVGMCTEFGDNPIIEGTILANMSAWIHLFNVVIPENKAFIQPGN